jgi:hypothetical protein
MADHQRHAGLARSSDDLAPLLDRGSDRLLDQHVDLPGDAGERDLVMQMRGRRDGDGIDAFGDELVERFKALAIDEFRRARPVRRRGIDDSHQVDAGKPCEHARMVASHHARADDADVQAGLGRRRSFGTHLNEPRSNPNPQSTPSTGATFVANAQIADRTRFDSKSYTFPGP